MTGLTNAGLRHLLRGLVVLVWLLWPTAMVYAAPLQLWFEKYELSATLEQLCGEFTAATGIPVTATYLPNGELRNTAMRSVAQGTFPDVLLVPSDFIGSRGPMQLSPVAADMVKGLEPAAIQSVTSRDGLYGVPLLYGNHLMLMYNKSLVGTPAADWQSLLGQRAAVEGRNAKLIGWKVAEMYWLIPFFTAFGANPVVDGKLTLDSEAMVEALGFYKAQLDSGLINVRCGYECSHEKFADGEYAYAINGDWALTPVKSKLGNQLGLAVLPTINGGAMRPYSGSVALTYPGNGLSSANRESLVKLTQFLLTDRAQQRLTAAAGLLPADKKLLAALAKEADADTKARLAQLALAIPMPPEPEMAAAWVGMSKGFTLFMRNKTDAASAARLMQMVAEQELVRLNSTQQP